MDDSYFDDCEDDDPVMPLPLSSDPTAVETHDAMDALLERMFAAETASARNPGSHDANLAIAFGGEEEVIDSRSGNHKAISDDQHNPVHPARKSAIIRDLAPLDSKKAPTYPTLLRPHFPNAEGLDQDLCPNTLRSIHDPVCSNGLQRGILSGVGDGTVDVVVSGPAGCGKSWAIFRAIAAFSESQAPCTGPHVVIVTPSEKVGKATLQAAHLFLPPSLRVLEAFGTSDKKLVFESLLKHKKDNYGSAQQVVIGTPGRLIDLLSTKVLKLVPDCGLLVVENSDAFVKNGEEFSRQISAILGQMRPDRMVVCIGRGSAFGRMLPLRPSPVFLSFRIGRDDVMFLASDGQKWGRLTEILAQHTGHSVLVYVHNVEVATVLATNLEKHMSLKCAVLHGKLGQEDVTELIEAFCHRHSIRVAVATDDISPRADVVVSFDIHAGNRRTRSASASVVHYHLATLDGTTDERSLIDVATVAKRLGLEVPPAVEDLMEKDTQRRLAEEKHDRLYNAGQNHKGGIGLGMTLDPTKQSVLTKKIVEVEIDLPPAPPKTVSNPFGHRLFSKAPPVVAPSAAPLPPPTRMMPYQRQRSPSTTSSSSSSSSSSRQSSSSSRDSRKKKTTKHSGHHKHKKRKKEKKEKKRKR